MGGLLDGGLGLGVFGFGIIVWGVIRVLGVGGDFVVLLLVVLGGGVWGFVVVGVFLGWVYWFVGWCVLI